ASAAGAVREDDDETLLNPVLNSLDNLVSGL
uniref:Rothein 3.4 n=1 Tax=Litoria rothii TaxID=336074 RepID=ROT34_LITRO|nr:RecName: Full=Rothein 3.4 [Litoria rothii]